ncbi:MAG: hypothetical protein KJ069_21140 [Anaerolineae bacterium]|nr:hypothetical protein [Anaerolineae bacterium]
MLNNLEQLDIGDNDLELLDSFPDPDRIDFTIITAIYKQILLAISRSEINAAKKHNEELIYYIDRLVEEGTKFDEWLISRELTDLHVFISSLRDNRINSIALFEFCQNTLLHSSLPFLEKIVDFSQDYRLRLEASNAIQCIIRRQK